MDLGAQRLGRLITELLESWDPLRLDQVVTNLIDNAIKYGAGKPVAALVAREGGNAVLRVIDQGIGIAPAEQQRIFERSSTWAGTAGRAKRVQRRRPAGDAGGEPQDRSLHCRSSRMRLSME